MKVLVYFTLFSYCFASPYSMKDIEKKASQKYKWFDSKIDLSMGSYSGNNDRFDSGISLTVNLYDPASADARMDKRKQFIQNAARLKEEIIFSKAKLRLLKEKESFYLSLSEVDKKDSIARNKTINHTYVNEIFRIKEEMYQEKHKLNLAEKLLISKMGDTE